MSDYWNLATSTGVSRTYTETALNFPTVTICPINTQSKLKFHNLPVNYSMEKYIEMKNRLFLDEIEKTFSNKSLDFIDELKDAGVEKVIDFLETYQLSYDELTETDVLKELLGSNITCTYYDQECDATWFNRRVWNTNQLCIQFNSFGPRDEPLTANKVDNYYKGFQIYMDLGGTQYFQADSKYAGVNVILENYENRDDLLPINEIISIFPGNQMFIKLTESQVCYLL